MDVLGERWQSIFQHFFSAERIARLQQLRSQYLSPRLLRLAELLSTLHQGLHASELPGVDIWEQASTPEMQSTGPLETYPRLREYGSIFEQRLQLKSDLRDLATLSGYDALHAAS